MLLASKYEEIYPPQIRDLVFITDRAYNRDQILEMESTMANALEFRLTVPTIYCFLLRYLKVKLLLSYSRFLYVVMGGGYFFAVLVPTYPTRRDFFFSCSLGVCLLVGSMCPRWWACVYGWLERCVSSLNLLSRWRGTFLRGAPQ